MSSQGPLFVSVLSLTWKIGPSIPLFSPLLKECAKKLLEREAWESVGKGMGEKSQLEQQGFS